MRVHTLVFSILVHAMAVAAFVIAPLFATTELPEPHRSSVFEAPRPVRLADPHEPKEPARAAEPRSEIAAPAEATPTVAPIWMSDPVYPAIARTAKVQGMVILEAVISATGRVEDVKVLRSVPLLDDAAIDAVRQWQFTPTILNGEPIPVVMTVTVTFTLQPEAGSRQ
jgi:TonB family protein